MSKVARILLIVTMALSFLMVLGGIVLYAVMMYAANNEGMMTMIQRVLENYGIVDSNGSSSFFSTSDLQATLTSLASLIMGFGFLGIPCAIACIRALKYSTRGRVIGVIVTGVIGLNPLGIFTGIFSLIAFKRDDELY